MNVLLINLDLFDFNRIFLSIPLGTIGSWFVPYAREFPFNLTLQPFVEGKRWCAFFCKYFMLKFGHCCQGPGWVVAQPNPLKMVRVVKPAQLFDTVPAKLGWMLWWLSFCLSLLGSCLCVLHLWKLCIMTHCMSFPEKMISESFLRKVLNSPLLYLASIWKTSLCPRDCNKLG